MPNQVRVLVGSHTDFSLFITNPALFRVLMTNFDKVSNLNIQIRYLGRHLKNRLYLLRADVNTLLMVEPQGAVLSPKGKTVKTK